MGKEAEIARKFWKALRSDRTIMLGLTDAEEGHAQPMTAMLDGDADAGPIWIFSAKNVHLVKAMGRGQAASAQFAAKDHGLFATLYGRLTPDNDPQLSPVCGTACRRVVRGRQERSAAAIAALRTGPRADLAE